MSGAWCVWTLSEVRWHSDVWLSGCDPEGGGTDFPDGFGPLSNDFKFCPFCGKMLAEAALGENSNAAEGASE